MEDKEYENGIKDICDGARAIAEYLDKNSLARTVVFSDNVPPNFCYYETDDLDNVSVLIQRSSTRDRFVASGREITVDKEANSFYMPTWEFSLWHDNIDLQHGISKETLKKIKTDIYNEEENIFIDFVKEVATKNNNYIVCDSLGEAIEKISKIEHRRIWAGKDLEVDLPNLQKLRSPNLKGFILASSEIQDETGVISIRQDITILPTNERDKFVTYEEQCMMLINDQLTYIEVKE